MRQKVGELAIRVSELEAYRRLDHELMVRLIDLVHERDALREATDKELHLYVQGVMERVGQTLLLHRKNIERLSKLTTAQPDQALIDMKATNVWSPKK